MAKTDASNVTNAGTKPIGEVHDALIEEADKQAQFNRDANAIQTAQNQKFQDSLTAPNMKTADQARQDALDYLKAEADQANTGKKKTAASTEPVGPAPSVTQTITEGTGDTTATTTAKTKADTKS